MIIKLKMSSKSCNESPKPIQLNQKSLPIKIQSKEEPFRPNTEDLKPFLIEEKDINAQSLVINKYQISDLNILLKNSDMTRIKTYEIKSNEQITFLLSFEIVKEKMKISVIVKDSYPQNKYENYYTLEDFIKINKWFNIFNNIDKAEILLPVNDLTEIESKEINEIPILNGNFDNLSYLLKSNKKVDKAREEELLQNKQNENKSDKSDKSDNLEEIKDTFKLQIEKKIKNNNNINEVFKGEKRREDKIYKRECAAK